jgi:translation initiation factor IF-1
MPKEDTFIAEGEIEEALPNTLFRVKITGADRDHPDLVGETILCHLSGKMRRYYIKVMPGDFVKFKMTHYDLEKGRIFFRKT